MIELLKGGAYLINGTEIIPDDKDAEAAVAHKTGRQVTREEVAKQTIAYRILEDHNTSG